MNGENIKEDFVERGNQYQLKEEHLFLLDGLSTNDKREDSGIEDVKKTHEW